MDEDAVFYHVVKSYVRSYWNMKDVYLYEILPRNCNESHYTLQKYCIVYIYICSFII